MITIERDYVSCAFRDVHRSAKTIVGFERTLRIPDDGQVYPLPPGLGFFPLRAVADHKGRVPPAWHAGDAAMLPMWPSEALWIDLMWEGYPCAIKIGTSGVNAITGAPMTRSLQAAPQDYVVVPDQRWLDGYVVGEGVVRQFVAARFGEGQSVAEQLSAATPASALQLLFFPMTAEHYEWFVEDRRRATGRHKPIALAAGGKIRQEIYKDTFGIEAWTAEPAGEVAVHLVPADLWRRITRRRPPARVPTAKTYTDAGLPWFDYYNARTPAVGAQPALAGIKSVGQESLGKPAIEQTGAMPPSSHVLHIGRSVRE